MAPGQVPRRPGAAHLPAAEPEAVEAEGVVAAGDAGVGWSRDK